MSLAIRLSKTFSQLFDSSVWFKPEFWLIELALMRMTDGGDEGLISSTSKVPKSKSSIEMLTEEPRLGNHSPKNLCLESFSVNSITSDSPLILS